MIFRYFQLEIWSSKCCMHITFDFVILSWEKVNWKIIDFYDKIMNYHLKIASNHIMKLKTICSGTVNLGKVFENGNEYKRIQMIGKFWWEIYTYILVLKCACFILFLYKGTVTVFTVYSWFYSSERVNCVNSKVIFIPTYL